VFKFEEGLYKENNIECKFVGHPLIDIAKPSMDKDIFIKKFNLEDASHIISLLPGSRDREIRTHLPILIKTVNLINKKYPKANFIIVKSPGISSDLYQEYIKNSNLKIKLIEGYNYDCINVASFCIVASGTATLETAILEKPMLIIYKVSILSWLLLKPQVKVAYAGIVNIIANKEIIPELLQNKAKPKIIARIVCSFLENPNKQNTLINDIKNIKPLLGEGGASSKAAEEIIAFLK